jgi:hypothetical protein
VQSAPDTTAKQSENHQESANERRQHATSALILQEMKVKAAQAASYRTDRTGQNRDERCGLKW